MIVYEYNNWQLVTMHNIVGRTIFDSKYSGLDGNTKIIVKQL